MTEYYGHYMGKNGKKSKSKLTYYDILDIANRTGVDHNIVSLIIDLYLQKLESKGYNIVKTDTTIKYNYVSTTGLEWIRGGDKNV